MLRETRVYRRSVRGVVTIRAISGRRITAVLGMAFAMAILLVPAGRVLAQDAEVLERADQLIEEERPQEVLALLQGQPGHAEVYWRRAAATLIHGDQRGDAGAEDSELLDIFQEGERYADQAIAADPTNPAGYYWKSANIGRWGQTRGVLNSLFRAPDMRDLLEQSIAMDPEHADSYFVLGQLYTKVPGLISFGDSAKGVSLGRRAVDLMEAEVRSGERPKSSEAFYVELANSLIERGWNARRRTRQLRDIADNYRSAGTPLERGYYYEGSLSLPGGSDQDEAREILRGAIRRLERTRDRAPSETRRLEEARELLAGI
jgi:tetratricopeptide (TPR) repeat protein